MGFEFFNNSLLSLGRIVNFLLSGKNSDKLIRSLHIYAHQNMVLLYEIFSPL